MFVYFLEFVNLLYIRL